METTRIKQTHDTMQVIVLAGSLRNEEQSRRSSCGSQGTSDLSKVAFSNNHLRLTELPDLGGGRTAAKE